MHATRSDTNNNKRVSNRESRIKIQRRPLVAPDKKPTHGSEEKSSGHKRVKPDERQATLTSWTDSEKVSL